MQAWYDAEVCRGRLDPNAGAEWQQAARACREADLAWDEAYAQRRAPEALLSDRFAREPAVAALRRANRLATDLQAAPLLAQVARLARGARIVLTDGTIPAPVAAGALTGLTPREREIVSYVAAGRTYREIAAPLSSARRLLLGLVPGHRPGRRSPGSGSALVQPQWSNTLCIATANHDEQSRTTSPGPSTTCSPARASTYGPRNR
jgi:hypothetical protein